MSECKVDGCEREKKAKGLCEKHYRRFKNHGDVDYKRPSQVKDMTGKRFSFLEVISRHGLLNKTASWLCKCDCGKEAVVRGSYLRNGTTKSCGCYHEYMQKITRTTHGATSGETKTAEYTCWVNIRQRCENKSNEAYKRYGGRGIAVCDRWQIFENFYVDMGNRPTTNHSIERKNNDKGYSKDNCKWATKLEQANNKRNNIFITYDGKTKTIPNWSRHLGINVWLLRSRKRRGWSDEDILCGKQ